MISAGSGAEDEALAFLRGKGLRLLERNYRCRFGEIDLIMNEGTTLVFVEVRMRKNASFGGAAESITVRKQKRIIAAARHYLSQSQVLPRCRFDAMLLGPNNSVDWIRDAFGE
ncbi:MAG: YraN family protein [Betaproteobacteria bacterium]|nr:YraN family protein [Betaproteobacteria bacterium]